MVLFAQEKVGGGGWGVVDVTIAIGTLNNENP